MLLTFLLFPFNFFISISSIVRDVRSTSRPLSSGDFQGTPLYITPTPCSPRTFLFSKCGSGPRTLNRLLVFVTKTEDFVFWFYFAHFICEAYVCGIVCWHAMQCCNTPLRVRFGVWRLGTCTYAVRTTLHK